MVHPVHLDIASERGGVAYGRHHAWDGQAISSLDELPTILATLADRSV